jgi:hypothetical protein
VFWVGLLTLAFIVIAIHWMRPSQGGGSVINSMGVAVLLMVIVALVAAMDYSRDIPKARISNGKRETAMKRMQREAAEGRAALRKQTVKSATH